MKRILVLVAMAAVVSVACHREVKRVETGEVIDISGRWNDTDSRLVSEEMIKDCLARSWVDDFRQSKHRSPVVIVGAVRNKSMEHINTETFTKDLERALLNSGKVSFVASKEEREGVREERSDMERNATEETRKSAGKESGADYMIIGSINTIFDREKKEQVSFYQVNLEAVDMNDNRKVWIGEKKIKKYIKAPNKKF